MRSLTPKPPEWIDSAPLAYAEAVEIAAPPSAVWPLIADHASWPSWFSALDSVVVTGAADGVGGERTVVTKRIRFDEVFTAWDEPNLFAFCVVRTSLPLLAAMAESVRIEPNDAGCRVVYRQGLEARRYCGKLLALATRRMPTMLRSGLGTLRERAEAR